MRVVALVLSFCLVLSGCATSSTGGIVLGIHGGVEWLKRAPDADVDAHLGQKSLVQLRLMWDRFYDQPKIRERIARQLELRGEDPMMFWDNATDNSSRTRDLEGQLLRQQIDACTARGGSFGAGYCYGGK